MKKITENKAITLVEALPYIKQFSGRVMVIKYGGSLMVNEELRKTFASLAKKLCLLMVNDLQILKP